MTPRGSRGQSLVESALVLAAFLGMLLGIVNLGEALYSRQTLAERAHDAARWGALHPYDPAAIRNVVLYGSPKPERDSTAVLGLAVDAVKVTNPGCPGVDCRVVVAVSSHGIRSVEPVE
jgi:hypothetical protein